VYTTFAIRFVINRNLNFFSNLTHTQRAHIPFHIPFLSYGMYGIPNILVTLSYENYQTTFSDLEKTFYVSIVLYPSFLFSLYAKVSRSRVSVGRYRACSITEFLPTPEVTKTWPERQ